MKLRLLQALTLFLATLAVFAPALHGGWLWDDDILITQNPVLRNLRGLWALWFAPHSDDYWPLTTSLQWIEWHLWHEQTFGYHLVNLALHLTAGFLLWQFLARIGLRWGWFGALLFLIHPLAVESVAWVSETKNMFSLIFYLLALNAFLDHEAGPRSDVPWRALGWYFAALLAKSSTVMLPCIFLLYRVWKNRRLTRNDALDLLPFFLLALLFAWVTFFFQQGSHVLNADVARMRADPFYPPVIAAQAIFFYLEKFFFPIHLFPIYPRWPDNSATWMKGIAALGLFLAGTAWLGRELLRGRGAPAFWLGFFFLNILPTLGLIEMSYMNVTWVADHFAYLPMIGLVGLSVLGLETFSGRLDRKGRQALQGTLAVLVIVLILISHREAKVYRDYDTFWHTVARQNPGAKEVPLALGVEAFQQSRLADAIADFQKALEIYPDYTLAHNDLGLAFEVSSNRVGAQREFETALRLNPKFRKARLNLDHLLQSSSPAPAGPGPASSSPAGASTPQTGA